MVNAAMPVLVVDDHPAVRQGVQAMIEAEPDLGPVSIASGSRDALALAPTVRPRVCLIDYHLPDEDGLWLCLRLKALEQPPQVLMYSAFTDDMLVLLAFICGLDGLVSKSAVADELCDALRSVAERNTELPAPSPAAMQSAVSGLDADDLPIVGMLVHHTPLVEIADTLGVDESWVTARRWAIVEQIRGRPPRRSRPSHPV